AMTPLQMLTFYNGIANNGKVMKPMFVSQVLKDGVVKEQFEPIVLKEQMCKQSTLLKIQDVLERVVLYGTGKKLRSAPYGIAGKSGTAEIGYDNTSQVLRHRASFVGYFPADNPQYSCIVVISEPHKALTHGGDLAAPVFRELSDRVIGSGLASYKSKVNEDKVVRPVMNYGHAGDYAALCRNLGFMDTYSDIWIKAIVTDSAVHYNPVKIKEGIMPEVKGLTLKDAVYMLEKMGLKVEIQGYGRVVSQSIEKNQPINKGDKVVLTAGRL
ncbi:MAG: PASTA domain-containing protein, partial [Bacteroidales bacterium]|nr:PASTA domain-containing protein [Bacteroidales bacterium]